MRIDNESTNRHYIVQLTSKPYILQEDKEMKGYTPLVTAYVCKTVYDAVFFYPVHNTKYWSTPMNKEDGDITVRLKQVLLSTITTMKIDKRKNYPRGATKSQRKIWEL